MELGEALEEAAIREAKEETNLDIEKLTLLGTTSGKEMYVVAPNGHQCYFISIGYYTKSFKGEMIIDGSESMDLKFFALHNLPSNMPKSHRSMISLYIMLKDQME